MKEIYVVKRGTEFLTKERLWSESLNVAEWFNNYHTALDTINSLTSYGIYAIEKYFVIE